MKTFEVYVPNNGEQKLIARVQADYFKTDHLRANLYRVTFYAGGFWGTSLAGQIYVDGEMGVFDTEFAIAPQPEPKAFSDALPVASDDITMDEVLASAPTPRRRKSKGSTLGLD